MTEDYTLISLFSGAGGMDLGFKEAGFNILWANDFNEDATITYKNNIGEHIVLGDICQIESNEIPDNPDVIIGGFPCQGFSVANIKRNMGDKRNFLYKEMLRIIRDKKPKIFVAENVKGLLSMEKGKIIEMIKKDFENIGYSVDYKVLNAADYGVPQIRERVIIMGNRIKVNNIFATSPEFHVNKKRRLSARECAILQTFPDDFIFHGSLSSMYRQIGNAVPVLLGNKIVESCIKMLDDGE